MLRRIFASRVALATSALALNLALGAGIAGAQDSVPPDNSRRMESERLGTQWRVATDPHIIVNKETTAALAGGLMLLTGLLAAHGIHHRQKGAMPRTLASGILALSLCNPELVREEYGIVPTEVDVVIDKSASQSLADRGAVTAEAYSRLMGQLAKIDGIHVNTIEAGKERTNGTRLFGSLHHATAAPDTVFMLTDGIVHDVPAAPEKVRPLHVLLSGRDDEKDRMVVIDEAPGFGLINRKQAIRFHVAEEGAGIRKGGKVNVSVDVDGKRVSNRAVEPGKRESVDVVLNHMGANVVEIQTEALDGELTPVNNRAAATIEGVREDLRVLFISGAPSQGVRAWRNLLKADPDTKFVHFMVLRPLQKLDDTPPDELAMRPFPMEEVFSGKDRKFDLVIFDHYGDEGVLPPSYLKKIADYVRGGGALMVVSGPEYAGPNSLYNSPLGAILPARPTGRITETPYAPQATKRGERHPVVRNLGKTADAAPPAWGRWFQLIDSRVTSGETVMQGADNAPLLILDRDKGKGRVAMLMSDQAWLWARGIDGGGPFAEIMTLIPHWLMQDPSLEEESLRLSAVRDGSLIVEQQTMADKNPSLALTTPTGRRMEIVPDAAGPGIWRKTLAAETLDGPGLYAARQEGKRAAKAYAGIGSPNPKEWEHTVSTANSPLADYAAATGGGVARMTDSAGRISIPRIVAVDPAAPGGDKMAGPGWMGVRVSNKMVLKGVKKTPLPPPMAGLLAAMALLAYAYRLESGKPVPDGKKPGSPAGPQ